MIDDEEEEDPRNINFNEYRIQEEKKLLKKQKTIQKKPLVEKFDFNLGDYDSGSDNDIIFNNKFLNFDEFDCNILDKNEIMELYNDSFLDKEEQYLLTKTK